MDPYGGALYDQKVMDKAQELQKRGVLKFGFDRAGASTMVKEDEPLFASGDPEQVCKTQWFYGYKTAAKAISI